MQQIKTLITLVLVCIHAYMPAQTKKTAPPKKTANTKLEIDRLEEKYKDSHGVTLYTSHGELTGIVVIVYNPDDKPQSIMIEGTSSNIDAVAEFISQMIAQKKQQGYKSADGNTMPTDANWIREAELEGSDGVNRTFKKGTMYFIVKGGSKAKWVTKQSAIPGMLNNTEYVSEYWFSIETGDYSRKGGSKATKFDF